MEPLLGKQLLHKWGNPRNMKVVWKSGDSGTMPIGKRCPKFELKALFWHFQFLAILTCDHFQTSVPPTDARRTTGSSLLLLQITSSPNSNIGHQLFTLTILTPRHQALQIRWVRIAINVDQEWWRHQVGCSLCLLIQNMVVRVSDERSVVCVEEQLTG